MNNSNERDFLCNKIILHYRKSPPELNFYRVYIILGNNIHYYDALNIFSRLTFGLSRYFLRDFYISKNKACHHKFLNYFKESGHYVKELDYKKLKKQILKTGTKTNKIK